MIDDPEDRNDPDTLAAEYAFGLLEGDALAVARELVNTDPQFAMRVRRWEALGLDLENDAPQDAQWSPDALWQRIEAGFPAEPLAEPLAQGVPAAAPALPQPANDYEPPAKAAQFGSAWQMSALAASLAAVVFGGLYVGERGKVEQINETLAMAQAQGMDDAGAIRVAQVSAAGGDPLLTVMYEGAGGKLTARIATIADKDLVPELWVIGPDGKPRSLGQSTSGSVMVVELTEQMRADIAAGSSIAISLEEAADQPSARPTADRILGAARLAPVS